MVCSIALSLQIEERDYHTITITDKYFKSLINLSHSWTLTACHLSRMSHGIWGIGIFQYDGLPILRTRLQILDEYAHTIDWLDKSVNTTKDFAKNRT